MSRPPAGPLCFVGLLPPPALADQIVTWQRRLEHDITVPHVTLKAPAHLSAEQLAACQRACRHRAPFEVTLGGVGTFDERVIYLTTRGEGLKPLHAALVAAIGEPVSRTELDGYHPHLTVALSRRPLNPGLLGNWAGVLGDARREFARLEHEPLRFTVSEAVLFSKERPGQPYSQPARWPLTGEG